MALHDPPGRYVIEGGQPLVGSVRLSGAKNLANKLMIASLLASKPCTLQNVPEIGEIDIVSGIIQATGAHIERRAETLTIDPQSLNQFDLRQVTSNRIPILAAGPLLRKTGRAILPAPGGDRIGLRPIDFHLDALTKLGAHVEQQGRFYVLRADRLRGAMIQLPFPSVGATENVLLAATTAEGVTELRNGAIEPEILELVRFLCALGARIERTERTYVITGTRELGGADWTVMPDRIEAVSYIALALATRGEILIEQAGLAAIDAYRPFLDEIGANYELQGSDLRIRGNHRQLRATTITTGVHPGFLSDWQQPSAVVLVTATGDSTIHETVFEDRFGYVRDFRHMGAMIEVTSGCSPVPCRFDGKGHAHVATIHGPSQLHGTELELLDIRAGMAHLIAALAAQGTSVLHGIHHLDRGYGTGLQEKLTRLGASITRFEH
ncbi:UDP-N-acetylglucosamine 1-carboxyvinyltransferase [Candidatus Berkelbacteria bacterium]|nr:UDP-N-acetylglucosamine 1-carboxyvinyltransferase [Candidatus Berkelbacteria bacterium]